MKLSTATVPVTLASAPGLQMYGPQLGRHINAHGVDEQAANATWSSQHVEVK